MVSTALLTGRPLGHHVVLETLGEGGMGVVYKARDTRLDRLVAIKLLRRDWAGDPERRRRFLGEARAASALNHPNILTVYEIDSEDGLDYIVMEYLAGGTLADLVARGPLPVARALGLVAQVADGLAAAHESGIVHRDLKPSNIMLAGEERVKIVDFGLAKVLGPAPSTEETAARLTEAGTVLGTAPYMSPEQAAGQSLDARSDLFSLGSILYEMLSGRRPFDRGSTVGTLAAILHETPSRIPGLAPWAGEILDRCLRKEPSERFGSARELKAAIENRAGARSDEVPSVAVLPFANMSGTAEDGYLCEGLAEEIINALTRIRGLRVIARTSSFVVGRLGLDACEAGRRLGVKTLLEGSVRRSGPRVRVTVQLVNTDDGSHAWSERYDRELADALVLEDEIAEVVAARLSVDLRGRERKAQSSVDAEAYQAYLEGRSHFARGTPEALARAKQRLEHAVGRDPGFALAFDALAELYWYFGFFGGMPPREAFSVSTWHALRALELDDSLAEAHALLGMLRKELDYNWPEVERELRRARELSPDSPVVHLRHAICGFLPQGRMDEALAELDRVIEADPLSIMVRWWAGVMAYLAGRPERMQAEGRHAIELAPEHFLGFWTLGMGLEGSGALDEGIAAMERAHELSGGMPVTLGFLALIYGRAGRRADALALIERAERLAADGYYPPMAIALGRAGLGEWDAALEWMDRAVEMRDPLIMAIRTYPWLEPVRDDPRYRAMLRKMNLDPPADPVEAGSERELHRGT